MWWILAATAFRSSGAVPTPPAVLHQFAEDGWDFYWTNASVTLRGAAVGYLWGNLLALAVALVVLLLPVTEGVATQLAVISHCMPLTAIGPIILVVFGGRAPTIFLAALSVFFTTLVGALLGLRAADKASLDVVTAYGGNRWHRNLVFGLRSAPRPPIDLVTAYGGSKVTVLRKVAVPTAMPAFFASSRIAVPGSLIGGADRGMARHRSGHRGRDPARDRQVPLQRTVGIGGRADHDLDPALHRRRADRSRGAGPLLPQRHPTLKDRRMNELTEFITGVPKCELHLHIEGTLEPELKFDLAARNKLTLPYADAAEMRAAYAFHDLASFLEVYYEGMAVLLTEQDFYDLAWAYLSKAQAQNVRYAEIFFDPQAHTSRGVSFDTVIRGLRRAVLDARRLLDLRAQLIMCFLRDFSAEYAMATLLESLPYKEWIIGVGLDSDERDNPPVKFAAVFGRARAEGYFLTMHCDVDQEDSTEHIRQCLDVIGVDRIDHGVNSLDDPALHAEIARRGLGLTVCPISNGYVTGDRGHESIRRMLDLGMRVTVNSDDPAYFNGYVTENLLVLSEAVTLSAGDVVRLERNAFEVAWLPNAVKDGYLAELDAYGPA